MTYLEGLGAGRLVQKWESELSLANNVDVVSKSQGVGLESASVIEESPEAPEGAYDMWLDFSR